MGLIKIFVKENEIEEQAIEKPLDYRYLKLLRLHMLVVNAWPGENIDNYEMKYGILITLGSLLLELFYFLDHIYYMKKNIISLGFYEMGHTTIMLLMDSLCMSRLILIALSQRCKDVVVAFFNEMHLFYFKDNSEHSMKVHKKIHFISHVFTLCLSVQLFTGLILFLAYPVYLNIAAGNYKHKILQNATFEYSFYIELPFNTETNLNGYLIRFSLDVVAAYICCAWVIMLDLLLSIMIFHLWGHYTILLYELDSFPLPAKEIIAINNNEHKMNVEMYSEDELKEVTAKLIRCINYHRLITNFTNRISEAYGPMLFIYYAFHQICGCLLLVECSQMTTQAFMCYGPLTVVIFQQLIQLSAIFEIVGTTSGKLKDAVYGVPWEYMDVKNRKIVSIFLMNVQEPIHVKALGLASVGVTTMASIIKTSVTYFTFLQSIGNQ